MTLIQFCKCLKCFFFFFAFDHNMLKLFQYGSTPCFKSKSYKSLSSSDVILFIFTPSKDQE